MGRIYSAARFVNIWLGPDEDDSGYLVGRLNEPDIYARRDAKFERGVECFLRRPWFGRLWVRLPPELSVMQILILTTLLLGNSKACNSRSPNSAMVRVSSLELASLL
jgi:hypothetical protein